MNYIEYNNLRLEYKSYGTGNAIIFAFHGFGRHAIDFKIFEPYLKNHFTIYAFNLFHHGKSYYPESRVEANTLTKKEWCAIIEKALEKFNVEKISLMGYSLGGKMCLLLAEMIPHRIERLLLYAPDGIKKNFWYHFASNTAIGKRGYKYVLKHPQIFFRMVNFLRSSGVINEKIKKFAINNMDSKKKRELVYTVWLTFKTTNPNIKRVAKNVKVFEIEVYQFFGQFDKVIPPRLGKYFSSLIKQPEKLFVLEKGHGLLTNDVASLTAQLLIQPTKKGAD